MPILETYEWCDFWWDQTNRNDLPRVLLVGDSITKGYRRYVSTLLEDVALIDMLATSRAVDNPALVHELKYMLGEHSLKHDLIHFNNGLHGAHLAVEDYNKGLLSSIAFLRRTHAEDQIILVTSTPVTVKDNVAMLDQQKNAMVIERNQVVMQLADHYELRVNDLYQPMLSHPEYRSMDGYHYTVEGQQAQAGIVAQVITAQIKQL